MRIWTYETSHETSPYWMHGNTAICLIEDETGHRTWRRISDGAFLQLHAHDYHQGKLLDRAYWPQWYIAMDETYVDVGI